MLLIVCAVFSSCKIGTSKENISLEELEKRAANFLQTLGETDDGHKFHSEEGIFYVEAKFIDKERHCIYYSDINGAFCKYDLLEKRKTLELSSENPLYIVCKNKKEPLYMESCKARLLDDNIHIVLQRNPRTLDDNGHHFVLFNTIDSTYQYITTTDGKVIGNSSKPLIIGHYVVDNNLETYEIRHFYDLEGNLLGNDGYIRDFISGEVVASLPNADSQAKAKKQQEETTNRSGYFTYEIQDHFYLKSFKGAYQGDEITADGIFLLVYLNIKNTSREPKGLYEAFFSVTDKNGLQYNQSSNVVRGRAEILTNRKVVPLKTQPNIPVNVVLVFEVPKEGEYDLHFWCP